MEDYWQTAAVLIGAFIVWRLTGIYTVLQNIAGLLFDIRERTPEPPEIDDGLWPSDIDIEDARRSDQAKASDRRAV